MNAGFPEVNAAAEARVVIAIVAIAAYFIVKCANWGAYVTQICYVFVSGFVPLVHGCLGAVGLDLSKHGKRWLGASKKIGSY